MIIRSVELFNIRSHRNTKLEFGDGINVFIGGTGSGKTSILMAIEFALFGSESIRDLSLLLNRRAGVGKVVLEFEHNGKLYKIVRGLVREGRSIRTDNSSLRIYEDGRVIFSGGRVQEMNEKIKEILGFPRGINPAVLFEILFYSRQDEIRKIIEMRKEERQTYIDHSLLLDRYKKTWENMKEVIDSLKREVERLEYELRMAENFEKELERIGEEVESKEREKSEIEEKLREAEVRYTELKEEVERIKREVSEVEKEREELIRKASRRRFLEEEIKRIEKEIEELRSKMIPVEFDEGGYEGLKEEYSKLIGKLSFLKGEREKIEREIEKVRRLEGKTVCPLCKQPISKEHVEHVLKEFLNEKDKIIQEMIVLEEEKDKLLKKIREMEEKKRMLDEVKRIEFLLKKKEIELEEKLKKLKEMEEIEEKLPIIDERYQILRSKREEILKEYLDISKEYTRLKTSLENLDKIIADLKRRREEIERKVSEAEKKRKSLEELKKVVQRLELLREEIRNIRELVRLKFLEDFRREFSRWFRTIRREEYYRVDVDTEYEPKAYTPEGLEVPISSLSGGERTSVALAYRLALSTIVSKLGGVSRPELLILDEPTTGLDEDDIRVLPEILRSLGLKQVIVVTHSRELKEAGDVKFLVSKESGWTKVERVED